MNWSYINKCEIWSIIEKNRGFIKHSLHLGNKRKTKKQTWLSNLTFQFIEEQRNLEAKRVTQNKKKCPEKNPENYKCVTEAKKDITCN